MRRLLIALVLLAPGVASAKNLAVVNGTPITQAQVLAANPAAKGNPTVTQETLQTLINRTLLLARAKAEKIPEHPAYQSALAAQKENLLINFALNEHFARHPVSKEQIQTAYQALVKSAPDREYRVREIIVNSRPEAEKIIASLAKGKDFSILAAAHSAGPNAAVGGELGWVALTQLQVSLGKAISKLHSGEVAGPIAVPEGWAIVQLLGEHTAHVLPLEALHTRLETELRQKATNEYLEKLRKEAKVQILSEKAAATEEETAHVTRP
ncbi:peptidylprolyl isomerase [Acidithiobacillus ferrooxidans]|uniref:peptidylprolyl isomerase n=1 Tax=Acidithiobacillus ferrooxidans TaxID=920 RepID=UPI001C075FF1|nr:peptidylprolyl isomerase [Acidithiobacillus ferrooxidans]MBU2855943.1 peptidylprolyl isomerase [Acidithiobacillus ferrooxidans]